MTRRHPARGFVDDGLGFEDPIDIGGGATHVVRECHCRTAYDEQLRSYAARVEFPAKFGEQRDDLLAAEREVAAVAHTDANESCSTSTPRAANSAGA
ncbi:hypothetical protein GCM10028864_26430 [Microlunatus parietis]